MMRLIDYPVSANVCPKKRNKIANVSVTDFFFFKSDS